MVPSTLCDATDSNLVIYVDTDSNYLHADPILEHTVHNLNDLSDEERDNKLECLATKLEEIVTKDYDRLAKQTFGIDNHRLVMKTECVIRAGYFREKRRYAQWITKQEGISKESLDIKGLEFMKSNFPPILGEFFNSILKQALKGGNHKDITDQIKEFKNKIIKGGIPIEELGNPTAVKQLTKVWKDSTGKEKGYIIRDPKAGEIFTQLRKGAPAPVRAAARHNDLLRLWKLDKQHNYITLADKVKWLYLKDNPYKIEALAFIPSDISPKIKEFLEQYADRRRVWESILLNKLEGFYSDLEWDLSLNDHIKNIKTFRLEL